MTFLASPPREQRQSLQTLVDTPVDTEALNDLIEPGFFEGSGTAAVVGLGRVGAVANQLAGEAEAPFLRALSRPLDQLFDSNLTGFVTDEFERAPAALTASMTPDPQTTGTLGRILYGVVGIGVPAAVGGYFGGPAGAAALAGTFDAEGTATDLQAQGVDPSTAALAGAGSGLLTAAGVAAPAALGGRVALSTLLYGPGINVAQDVLARKSVGGWLAARGYDELGDRYATIEAEGLAADVVLGAAFGWAGARGAVPRGTKPTTAEIDAALTAQDVRHAEIDSAPGVPADLAAQAAHGRNLAAATEALLAGRPVKVEPVETLGAGPRIDPRYDDEAMVQAFREYAEVAGEVDQLEAALAARGRVDPDEALPTAPQAGNPFAYRVPDADWSPPAIPRDGKLTGEFATIEGRFADAIARDVDGAIGRYAELRESEGGKVLNTDVARELSPDYRADRSRSAAVHEPASWLVKEMYRRALERAPAPGEQPRVLFTGGGTGAGKTTAIEAIPAMAAAKQRAQLVYDTNLSTFASSVQKIEQALKAGKQVHIAYVLRDPVEALVKGALPRAERMGRTVPLPEHAKTHRGATDVMQRLAEHYANDARVKIDVIDNTRGKGKAKLADVAFGATFDYSELTGRLRAALDDEYEKGNVSEAVYRGTAGETAGSRGLRRTGGDAAGRGEGAAGPVGGDRLEAGRGPGHRGDGARPERDDGRDPGLDRVARQVVADDPELTVPNDAGEAVPAAAVLADADAEVARAEQDAPGFDAAVDCFLRSAA